MPRPTKKQLRNRLDALAKAPTTPASVKELATNLLQNDRQVGGPTATTESKLTRFNQYLGQADNLIELDKAQHIVSWLGRHAVEADDPNADPALVTGITTMKTRLKALEASGAVDPAVKAFLTQILERAPAFGLNDDEALDRLDAELRKPPAQVDATRLERLTERAKAIWESLADE